MAYTTIDKPSKYFNTVLYTGNGSTQSITGVGFQPDFVWAKSRSNASFHILTDLIRGVNSQLYSNSDTTQGSSTTNLTAFNSDGFTLGSESDTNGSARTYVAWNWLGANTTVSNTSGTITSTVSANTTSGFSIVSYTGNGTSGATVGHGLGTTPSMFIIKNRIDSSASFWCVYHKSAFVSQSNPNILYLNSTGAESDDINVLGNSTVTINSNVFSLGDYNGSNGSGDAMIAYCFADVKGFSKAFSYTGNGSADGTFVHLGFRPAWVMTKASSTGGAGYNWQVWDNKRNTYNAVDTQLRPNTSEADNTDVSYSMDFVSNGFKMRGTGTNQNGSGVTYIGFAIAEQPFVSSKGIVANAR